MVKFVSIFCPKLQKLLKPIYDLMRKVRQFVWGDEQQAAFEEIKGRLQKSPVLHLPDKKADSNYIQTPAKLLLVVLIPNSEWQTKTYCIC